MSIQHIDCHVVQLSTNTHFYITFIYGLNQLQQRKELWADSTSLQPLQNPWCMLCDFNSILYKEDRIGGDDVLASEIRDMKEFMDSCDLQELRSIGAYYSWTNKTVMTRIDRALINEFWYDLFNFTQVRYDANSLLDHTPLLIQFLQSPKPRTSFHYSDMWSKHRDFSSIISSALPNSAKSYNLT